MCFEILVRIDGKEKWVDGRKVFKYLLEDYSKISYGGKTVDPYNTRIKKFYSNIPQELLETWKGAYPNVDINAQVKKCEAWLLCNTNKAKKVFRYKLKTKLDDLIKIMMDSELEKYNG